MPWLLQLDDPLDAIAVHAWNGTWGVIAVGLFAGEKLVCIHLLHPSLLSIHRCWHYPRRICGFRALLCYCEVTALLGTCLSCTGFDKQ
jgi:ammonia channel protein AmtB